MNAEELAEKAERLAIENMDADYRKREGLPPPDPSDGWEPTDDDDPRATPAKKASANDGRKPTEPSVFAQKWITLADSLEWLTDEPPPQRWLLMRWYQRRDHGVFPRGRTGLLTATGGVGKTYALIQLALAVAGGGFWLDTFRATEAGHVCLALAEEDADEARRRLWRAANALELSTEQRRDIATRIHVLPLAGVSVALTCSPERGIIVATESAHELRKQLDARGVEWSLIIIDPLSRWAGGGVEADNEAATRFCQVVETLTTVHGNPSILVAHHSSKLSAKDGSADARGVSGIRDGFRWQVAMDPVAEDGLRGVLLRNRKSNYSLEFDDMVLTRNSERGVEGTLRLATAAEAEKLNKGTKSGVADDEIQARVVETVTRRTGLMSASQIAAHTRGAKERILAAVKDLRSTGLLILTPEGFIIRPTDKASET